MELLKAMEYKQPAWLAFHPYGNVLNFIRCVMRGDLHGSAGDGQTPGVLAHRCVVSDEYFP